MPETDNLHAQGYVHGPVRYLCQPPEPETMGIDRECPECMILAAHMPPDYTVACYRRPPAHENPEQSYSPSWKNHQTVAEWVRDGNYELALVDVPPPSTDGVTDLVLAQDYNPHRVPVQPVVRYYRPPPLDEVPALTEDQAWPIHHALLECGARGIWSNNPGMTFPVHDLVAILEELGQRIRAITDRLELHDTVRRHRIGLARAEARLDADG